MADVFIDCEWFGGEYLTILGAYSYGQGRFQLYGDTLTRNRLSRFLNQCSERSTKDTLLFCHGPDLGRITKYFDLELKDSYYCVNTVTAFNAFTTFRDKTLGHLEQYFGLPRKYAYTSVEMKRLWESNKERNRRKVLAYNWEDCVNLWQLVKILTTEYRVTRGDLKSIAMEP